MANSTLRASCTANNNNTQLGDSAEILVDGSDTPVTANGLGDYQPTPGDRLLVQQVGGQVEIVQFLTRGTVPYLVSTDADGLQAQINATNTNLGGTQSDLAIVLGTNPTTLATAVQAGTSSALLNQISTLQGQHLVLGSTDPTAPNYNPGGIGPVGINADQFWVGDVTTNTVKLVTISAFMQTLVADGSAFQVLTDLGVGDVAFTGTAVPPMTTFYNYLTAHGVPVVAGKDYNA